MVRHWCPAVKSDEKRSFEDDQPTSSQIAASANAVVKEISHSQLHPKDSALARMTTVPAAPTLTTTICSGLSSGESVLTTAAGTAPSVMRGGAFTAALKNETSCNTLHVLARNASPQSSSGVSQSRDDKNVIAAVTAIIAAGQTTGAIACLPKPESDSVTAASASTDAPFAPTAPSCNANVCDLAFNATRSGLGPNEQMLPTHAAARHCVSWLLCSSGLAGVAEERAKDKSGGLTFDDFLDAHRKYFVISETTPLEREDYSDVEDEIFEGDHNGVIGSVHHNAVEHDADAVVSEDDGTISEGLYSTLANPLRHRRDVSSGGAVGSCASNAQLYDPVSSGDSAADRHFIHAIEEELSSLASSHTGAKAALINEARERLTLYQQRLAVHHHHVDLSNNSSHKEASNSPQFLSHIVKNRTDFFQRSQQERHRMNLPSTFCAGITDRPAGNCRGVGVGGLWYSRGGDLNFNRTDFFADAEDDTDSEASFASGSDDEGVDDMVVTDGSLSNFAITKHSDHVKKIKKNNSHFSDHFHSFLKDQERKVAPCALTRGCSLQAKSLRHLLRVVLHMHRKNLDQKKSLQCALTSVSKIRHLSFRGAKRLPLWALQMLIGTDLKKRFASVATDSSPNPRVDQMEGTGPLASGSARAAAAAIASYRVSQSDVSTVATAEKQFFDACSELEDAIGSVLQSELLSLDLSGGVLEGLGAVSLAPVLPTPVPMFPPPGVRCESPKGNSEPVAVGLNNLPVRTSLVNGRGSSATDFLFKNSMLPEEFQNHGSNGADAGSPNSSRMSSTAPKANVLAGGPRTAEDAEAVSTLYANELGSSSCSAAATVLRDALLPTRVRRPVDVATISGEVLQAIEMFFERGARKRREEAGYGSGPVGMDDDADDNVDENRDEEKSESDSEMPNTQEAPTVPTESDISILSEAELTALLEAEPDEELEADIDAIRSRHFSGLFMDLPPVLAHLQTLDLSNNPSLFLEGAGTAAVFANHQKAMENGASGEMTAPIPPVPLPGFISGDATAPHAPSLEALRAALALGSGRSDDIRFAVDYSPFRSLFSSKGVLSNDAKLLSAQLWRRLLRRRYHSGGLRTLKVNNTGLQSDLALFHLASGLSENTSLRSLSIAGNGFGDDEELRSAVRDVVDNVTAIVEVDAPEEGQEKGDDVPESSPVAGDTAGKRSAQSLKKAFHATAAAQALADACGGMEGGAPSNAGAIYSQLCAAIASHRSLEFLDMSNNGLDTHMTQLLAFAIQASAEIGVNPLPPLPKSRLTKTAIKESSDNETPVAEDENPTKANEESDDGENSQHNRSGDVFAEEVPDQSNDQSEPKNLMKYTSISNTPIPSFAQLLFDDIVPVQEDQPQVTVGYPSKNEDEAPEESDEHGVVEEAEEDEDADDNEEDESPRVGNTTHRPGRGANASTPDPASLRKSKRSSDDDDEDEDEAEAEVEEEHEVDEADEEKEESPKERRMREAEQRRQEREWRRSEEEYIYAPSRLLLSFDESEGRRILCENYRDALVSLKEVEFESLVDSILPAESARRMQQYVRHVFACDSIGSRLQVLRLSGNPIGDAGAAAIAAALRHNVPLTTEERDIVKADAQKQFSDAKERLRTTASDAKARRAHDDHEAAEDEELRKRAMADDDAQQPAIPKLAVPKKIQNDSEDDVDMEEAEEAEGEGDELDTDVQGEIDATKGEASELEVPASVVARYDRLMRRTTRPGTTRRIQALSLGRCEIGSNGLCSLSAVIASNCPSLRVLDISHNPNFGCRSRRLAGAKSGQNGQYVSPEEETFIEGQIRSEFEVSKGLLPAMSGGALVPGRRVADSFEDFDLEGEKKKRIKAMDDVLWVSHGTRALAAALQINTTLVSLDLSYCKLYPASLEVLAEAFHTNRTLRHLNLRGNFIGRYCPPPFVVAKTEVVVITGGTDTVTDPVRVLKPLARVLSAFVDDSFGPSSLETLILDACDLGRIPTPAPTCFSPSNARSTEWHTPIDQDAATYLAQLCHGSLDCLSLRGNNLTTSDLAAFSTALYTTAMDKKVGASDSSSTTSAMAGGRKSFIAKKGETASILASSLPEQSGVGMGGRRGSITDMTDDEIYGDKKIQVEEVESDGDEKITLLGRQAAKSSSSTNPASIKVGASFCVTTTTALRALFIGENVQIAGEDAGAAVARILQFCSKLEILSLSNCHNFGDSAMRLLSNKLSSHSALKVLAVSGCGLTTMDGLAYALTCAATCEDAEKEVVLLGPQRVIPPVSVLDAGNNAFSKESVIRFATALAMTSQRTSRQVEEYISALGVGKSVGPEVVPEELSEKRVAEVSISVAAVPSDGSSDDEGCPPPPYDPDGEDVTPSVSMQRQASRVASFMVSRSKSPSTSPTAAQKASRSFFSAIPQTTASTLSSTGGTPVAVVRLRRLILSFEGRNSAYAEVLRPLVDMGLLEDTVLMESEPDATTRFETVEQSIFDDWFQNAAQRKPTAPFEISSLSAFEQVPSALYFLRNCSEIAKCSDSKDGHNLLMGIHDQLQTLATEYAAQRKFLQQQLPISAHGFLNLIPPVAVAAARRQQFQDEQDGRDEGAENDDDAGLSGENTIVPLSALPRPEFLLHQGVVSAAGAIPYTELQAVETVAPQSHLLPSTTAIARRIHNAVCEEKGTNHSPSRSRDDKNDAASQFASANEQALLSVMTKIFYQRHQPTEDCENKTCEALTDFYFPSDFKGVSSGAGPHPMIPILTEAGTNAPLGSGVNAAAPQYVSAAAAAARFDCELLLTSARRVAMQLVVADRCYNFFRSNTHNILHSKVDSGTPQFSVHPPTRLRQVAAASKRLALRPGALLQFLVPQSCTEDPASALKQDLYLEF